MTKQWQKRLQTYPKNIRTKIEQTIVALLQKQFDLLDIKEMKWERKGHYRCRKWDIRIIYQTEWEDIIIKKIDSRWDVYK